MADYSKGKIYRIVGGDGVYIGSTTRDLNTRFIEHKHDFKRKARVTSCHLFASNGIDNCGIELIEDYPCASNNELKQREAEIIKNTPCVNKQVPGQTAREWYFAKPIEVRQEMERIGAERRRARVVKTDCECGGQYTTSNKKKHCRTNKHMLYLSSK